MSYDFNDYLYNASMLALTGQMSVNENDYDTVSRAAAFDLAGEVVGLGVTFASVSVASAAISYTFNLYGISLEYIPMYITVVCLDSSDQSTDVCQNKTDVFLYPEVFFNYPSINYNIFTDLATYDDTKDYSPTATYSLAYIEARPNWVAVKDIVLSIYDNAQANAKSAYTCAAGLIYMNLYEIIKQSSVGKYGVFSIYTSLATITFTLRTIEHIKKDMYAIFNQNITSSNISYNTVMFKSIGVINNSIIRFDIFLPTTLCLGLNVYISNGTDYIEFSKQNNVDNINFTGTVNINTTSCSFSVYIQDIGRGDNNNVFGKIDVTIYVTWNNYITLSEFNEYAIAASTFPYNKTSALLAYDYIKNYYIEKYNINNPKFPTLHSFRSIVALGYLCILKIDSVFYGFDANITVGAMDYATNAAVLLANQTKLNSGFTCAAGLIFKSIFDIISNR